MTFLFLLETDIDQFMRKSVHQQLLLVDIQGTRCKQQRVILHCGLSGKVGTRPCCLFVLRLVESACSVANKLTVLAVRIYTEKALPLKLKSA